MTKVSENNGIITYTNLCNLSVKIMHTEIGCALTTSFGSNKHVL